MSFIKTYRITNDIKTVLLIHYTTIENDSESTAVVKLKTVTGKTIVDVDRECTIKYKDAKQQKCHYSDLIVDIRELVDKFLSK